VVDLEGGRGRGGRNEERGREEEGGRGRGRGGLSGLYLSVMIFRRPACVAN
jgi:hypothetical protein